MIEPRCGLGFLHKTAHPLRVGGKLGGQYL